MTNFIPIFPLGIVVYPGENVNLHIFEPRYIQLIKECIAEKKMFGIPVVIKDQIMELGCLMEVVELVKEHENGTLDIKTRGVSVFRILELIKKLPEKLYSGAIVNHIEIKMIGSQNIMRKVVQNMRTMHKSIGVQKDFAKKDEELISYDVAHHVGLNLDDEYAVLELEHELHRQEFLKRHLNKMMNTLNELEHLKNKIQRNGHFKNLSGFQL